MVSNVLDYKINSKLPAEVSIFQGIYNKSNQYPIEVSNESSVKIAKLFIEADKHHSQNLLPDGST